MTDTISSDELIKAVAYEISSYRGEAPHAVDNGGVERWEAHKDLARAILSLPLIAPPSDKASMPVGVKALEWEEVHSKVHRENAQSVAGAYWLTLREAGYVLERRDGDYLKGFGAFDSVEAAKAAAQADYDARIRSALVPAISPPADELREALKPFADFIGDNSGNLPDDMPLTGGSPFARKQVTVADFRRARRALQNTSTP